MTFGEKLEVLQISEDDFHFYTSTFIQDRHRYVIKEAGQAWKEAKTRNERNIPLSDDVIAYHLLGKYTIGTAEPKKTQQFCVTIEHIKDFGHFYELILTYLQTPLVFFDSETRHLFFHTHLDFVISSDKLALILSWELDHRGIGRCPAPYKIFPGISGFLRLPLGRESYVIDPQSLKIAYPCSEVKGAIEFIRSHLRRRNFSDLFPDLKKNDGYPNHRW
jgi:hypothetical protein